jgi:hypothetical protein
MWLRRIAILRKSLKSKFGGINRQSSTDVFVSGGRLYAEGPFELLVAYVLLLCFLSILLLWNFSYEKVVRRK